MLTKKNIEGLIEAGLNCQIAACLHANPGEGKTEFVKEFAKTRGFDFIHINCHSLESTDLALPSIEGRGAKKAVEYIPCSWVKKAVFAENPTIVFLDEVNRIKPENANLLTTMVLEREVYGMRLSDRVMFVGAANFESNCIGVQELDTAIYTRFMHLLFEIPTQDAIEYIGDEEAQDFFRENLDLIESESGAGMFRTDVLSKLTSNKRSNARATKICQNEKLSHQQKSIACQGLLGFEHGTKFAQAWSDFKSKQARKVPPTLTGNEKVCKKLLSQGMVAEVSSLLQKEWKNGKHSEVVVFILNSESPELYISVIKQLKNVEGEKISSYTLTDDDVSKLVNLSKRGKKVNPEDIDDKHRPFLHCVVLYTDFIGQLGEDIVKHKES